MIEHVSHGRIGCIPESVASRLVFSVAGQRGSGSKFRAFGTGLLLTGAVAACGGRAPAWLGHASQAVLGGEASGADQDGVVMLTMEDDDTWSTCTATLVAPSLVVTAKHCVAAVQPGDFYCTGKGDPVGDGSGAGTFQALPPPETVRIYVGALPARQQPVACGSAIFATESEHVCRDDVAVVALDRPIDWVPIVPVGRGAPLRLGEQVSLVGYGTEELSDAPERRLRRGVRILDVGALTPEEKIPNPTTPPRTFAVGGGAVCFGDSGGPALNEAGELVGILSRLSGDCLAEETRNTYMVAKSFLDLLDRAVAAISSTEPPVEPEDGANEANTDELSRANDNALSGAGAPPSLETSETDDRAQQSSSSGAFRCQLSVDPSSRKVSRNLV
ncbi:MAG: trypsin-like serine protease, partial [Verrucomicrobia bacterium]|nr:trypsin-like serine protease [Verrucomicrobiota bacterium]